MLGESVRRRATPDSRPVAIAGVAVMGRAITGAVPCTPDTDPGPGNLTARAGANFTRLAAEDD